MKYSRLQFPSNCSDTSTLAYGSVKITEKITSTDAGCLLSETRDSRLRASHPQGCEGNMTISTDQRVPVSPSTVLVPEDTRTWTRQNFKRKSSAGSFLRSFFGLPFLEPNEVEDFFSNDLTVNKPKDRNIRKFCDYVYATYVESTATFPPALWAQYSAQSTRTTNACESLNSRLNSMFLASFYPINCNSLYTCN